MKLAASNIGWIPDNDQAVYKYMKDSGFTGLEIAPTRIIPDNPYDKLEEAKIKLEEISSAYGFTIPSIQSMWFGHNEKLLGSYEERSFLISYTKKAIDFAATINCPSLVFGCPRQRAIPDDMDKKEAKAILISFFKEICDYAYDRGTIIALEANPKIYNTNVMNTTKETLEMIKEVDSKGCLLNLDIGTMIENDESISSLEGTIDLINHVHISEPNLLPIKPRKLHEELKEFLLSNGYDKYISIEMGSKNDISAVYKSIDYVKSVFLC